ncbi:methylmalonyl Co-A mutase-associated GTPase MeaB [Algoriphagus sediminis]|uniref:Methylmalonyl Co-A mutase-associated GTPase MeaB n=1 Tax=Algoriphagus sediminis TaxID=3057113 RepID=A0ABT7YGB6_9BACT|nr:methylmalonyl Co-A mutase-associated GTPase MeaB [Algoriphagus sediminis]MDN3205542.1 methylmalonyl Co-A mutase-associated GTPase MeaB [Algoriphagus sediminis]
MKKRKSLEEYKSGILKGDRSSLAQAITLVESTLEEDRKLGSQLVQELLPKTGNSIRVGITGVPGVGKSTFIESFGMFLLNSGRHVAVLAIDPSSQKGKGSILGDKTRMEQLASDHRAFIRPSPSGNSLGGVSTKTREAMLLCEAAGFDTILIETVGVGQSETAVKNMVDFFLLLMLSGAGDELQGIKKGIMEMADGLVINKADGENVKASKLARQHYLQALHLFPPNENNWYPKVELVSSTERTGMEEIWKMIKAFEESTKSNGFWSKTRANQRFKWFEESVHHMLFEEFSKNEGVRKLLKEHENEVASGKISPQWLAQRALESFLNN